jgi:hypothetical protein
MQKYRCHKVVEAAKVNLVTSFSDTDAEGKPFIVPHKCELETDAGTFQLSYGEKMPQVGDYVVRYADGYISWSPAEPFEDGYTLITD